MSEADLLSSIKEAKLNNEFGPACLLSVLLLLRAPSETLLMRKAGKTDLLTKFTPVDHKIMVGIRTIGFSAPFIAKFA